MQASFGVHADVVFALLKLSVYGIGPLDDESKGITFDMKAGDVAVHAAGVAHRNVESSEDYEYAGFYPEVRGPRVSFDLVLKET